MPWAGMIMISCSSDLTVLFFEAELVELTFVFIEGIICDLTGTKRCVHVRRSSTVGTLSVFDILLD